MASSRPAHSSPDCTGGVIEKNRDARLLSPSALVAAAVGKRVELLRTNRKTGKTERLQGTILSDAGAGVVFKTDEGIEALRCSGLAGNLQLRVRDRSIGPADPVGSGAQPAAP